MTQSFDEWYFDAKQHNTDGFTNREFYQAGAQSRQAEIDELKSEAINVNNEFYANGQKSMRKIMQGRVDRLQKRIDKVLVEVNEYYDSDGMSDLVFLDILDILRGESDE